jgi:hypothetical protein
MQKAGLADKSPRKPLGDTNTNTAGRAKVSWATKRIHDLQRQLQAAAELLEAREAEAAAREDEAASVAASAQSQAALAEFGFQEAESGLADIRGHWAGKQARSRQFPSETQNRQPGAL